MSLQLDNSTFTAIVAIITALVSSTAVYTTAKSKLSAFRTFIDDMDDAVKDNNVTEQEFQKLWNDGKALL